MIQQTCELLCFFCDKAATHCEEWPDESPSPLCWNHAAIRRGFSNKISDLLRCEGQGIGRLDRDRCGGDVVCEECGKAYYDHPRDSDHSFMTVLCDGSAVKL